MKREPAWIEWLLIHGADLRRGILRVVIIGVPVFFLRTGVDPFATPKLALLMVGLGLVLGIRLVEVVHDRDFAPMKLLLIPAAAILVPLFIAWAFSPYRTFAVFGKYTRFQGLIPYVLVVLLGILIVDAFAGRAREVAWSLLIGGAVVGAYAVIQVIGLDPFVWQFGRGTDITSAIVSTVGNPNFTGGFLAIVLPIGVALWLDEPRLRTRAAQLLVPVAIGWVVAFSEGGWAGGIAGLCAAGGMWAASRLRVASVLGWIAAGGVALFVIAIVLAGVFTDSTRVPETADYRAQWWVSAWRMGADSPIVGRGPDAYAVDGVRYRTVEDAVRLRVDPTDDPHSVPLAFFANAGLLGALGFLSVAGWLLITGTREPDRLKIGFVGGGVAYFVQALVSIDHIVLRVALWSVVGGVAAATLKQKRAAIRSAARGKKRPVTTSLAPAARTAVVAAGAVVAVAGLYAGARFVKADYNVRHGELAFAAERIQEGEAHFERALSFRNDIYLRWLYGVELGNVAISEAAEGRQRIERVDRQLSFTDDVPVLRPLRDRALLLEEWASQPDVPAADALRARERSLALYERALEIDPHDPLLRAEVASLLAQLDRPVDALETLEPAIALAPDLPEAWAAAARAHHAAGDDDQTRNALDRVCELNADVCADLEEELGDKD